MFIKWEIQFQYLIIINKKCAILFKMCEYKSLIYIIIHLFQLKNGIYSNLTLSCFYILITVKEKYIFIILSQCNDQKKVNILTEQFSVTVNNKMWFQTADKTNEEIIK